MNLTKIILPEVLSSQSSYTLSVIPYDLNDFLENYVRFGDNHDKYQEHYKILHAFDDEEGYKKLKSCKHRSHFANLCEYIYDPKVMSPELIKSLAEELTVNKNIKNVYMELSPHIDNNKYGNTNDENQKDSKSSASSSSSSVSSSNVDHLVKKLNSTHINSPDYLRDDLNYPPDKDTGLIPHESPDFRHYQENYRGHTAVTGLDVNRAQNITKGESVRVHHIDDAIIQNHENFNNTDIYIIENRCNTNISDNNHGTSSSGIIAGNCMNTLGQVNGSQGIAPQCEYYFYSYSGRNQAYLNCRPGDIFSAEVQFVIPNEDPDDTKEPLKLPAVYNRQYYDMVKALVELGAVVIFSGGNGYSDVTKTGKMPYNNEDSGGIMCCACNPEGGRAYFSNYNYHKALNARGMDITTAGYGVLVGNKFNDVRSYTDEYSGTSAAQPQIAGCLALIQSAYYKHYHKYMDTQTMYDYVSRYGVDNTAIGIGYRPKVLRTILRLGKLYTTRAQFNRLSRDMNYFYGQLLLYGSLCLVYTNTDYLASISLPHMPPVNKYILFINDSSYNVRMTCEQSPYIFIDHQIKAHQSLELETGRELAYTVINS